MAENKAEGRVQASQRDNIFVFRRSRDGRQSFGTDSMQEMKGDIDPGRKSWSGDEGKRWVTDEQTIEIRRQ